MKSIGGGRVRYVGVSVFDGGDSDEGAGECITGGHLEVLWGDRVMETFKVHQGDIVRVADGANVEADAWLITHSWSVSIRADIPAGVEATVRLIASDDASARSRVVRVAQRGLVLVDAEGTRLASVDLRDAHVVMVADGDVVRRGARLAWWERGGRRAYNRLGGLDALRRFLDARAPVDAEAAIAPCDGEMESIEDTSMVIRAREGSIARVETAPDRRAFVREGDHVSAGDALTQGERSHHDLLAVWGEDLLAEHMLRELEIESRLRGLEIPRALWSLAVRAMLGWRRVLSEGDTGLARDQVLSRDVFERAQRETLARGGAAATAAPVLRGFEAMARERLRASRSAAPPRAGGIG